MVEESKSAAGLLRELGDNTRELARKELELARAEILEGIEEAQTSAMYLAVAAVPATVGLVLVALGISYLLDNFMPQWLAAFIPAVVLFAVSGIAMMRAKTTAERAAKDLDPERAKASAKRDARFVRNETSDAVT
jgi:hypothetical protein